ncbi:alpha/beta fold hydrolase [Streptomyces bobili]
MSAPILNEHKVPYRSKIPANYDAQVELPVREYDGTKPNQAPRTVLMLHGRSTPALAGFDLAPVPGGRATRYSWAQELANDGYDVFVMELQGSGRSPRPRMDEPNNAGPAQQDLLVPNPLPAPLAPSYPHQLGNSESEWDELNAVVTYIQTRPGKAGPIRFVGWSMAAVVMGPYALRNPGKVESLLLLAPIFPPKGRWSEKPDDPFGRPQAARTLPVSVPATQFGFPMFVGGRTGFTTGMDGDPALR